MKKNKLLLALVPLLGAALAACDDFGPSALTGSQGELRWTLDAGVFTKAADEIPDTNDFLLTIRDPSGKILYEGNYGDSPEMLQVEAGSYTVGIVSVPFTSPAFARPQYGDEQVVMVKAGQSVTVKLRCTLRNAGIRLQIAPDFLTSYPDGILYLQQGDAKLKYQYAEKRIAYVKPGSVSVLLYNLGQFETLYTRTMGSCEILSLQISAPEPAKAAASQISVQVDTVKNWITDNYVIGGGAPSQGGNSGLDESDAIPAGSAKAHIGEKGVLVFGYIVGGDLSSAGKNVKTSGIGKETHLAIADRSSVSVKASCVAVELPKGAVREALNLVDHPDLIGRKVYLKGNLVESYFGTTGLKATTDFTLK